MTPDERQALREKHGRFKFRDNRTFCVFCLDDYGLDKPHPCDVIKVLDATEELKPNDLKTKVECDHVTGSWIPTGAEDDEMWLEFTYCPKCGEKL